MPNLIAVFGIPEEVLPFPWNDILPLIALCAAFIALCVVVRPIGDRVYRVCDGLNEFLGRLVAWATLLMVLVQFTLVLMRYVFAAGDLMGISTLWWQESIVYMHGTLIMLAAGYTFLHNGHVRVDIFYSTASQTKQDVTDILGSILFLVPVCYIIWWSSWPSVVFSWPEMYLIVGDTLWLGDISDHAARAAAADLRAGGEIVNQPGPLLDRLNAVMAAAAESGRNMELPAAVRALNREDPTAFLGSEPLVAAAIQEIKATSWGVGPLHAIGGEGSTESSGIPAKWALKTTVLLFAVLVGLQALSTAIKASMRIAGYQVHDPHRTEQSLD